MKTVIIFIVACILTSCSSTRVHCPTYFGSKGSSKHKKSQTHYVGRAKSLGGTANR